MRDRLDVAAVLGLVVERLQQPRKHVQRERALRVLVHKQHRQAGNRACDQRVARILATPRLQAAAQIVESADKDAGEQAEADGLFAHDDALFRHEL